MSDKKQLNMRLTDEDLANVELLKQHEVSLAEVIRDALQQRAQALRPRKRDMVALIHELELKHPDPSSSPYEGVDTTDRRAVSEFIRSRLQAKTNTRAPSTVTKPLLPARKSARSKSKRKTG